MNEPLRVLVIEDDSDTRQNLADILALDGYLVATAGSAAESRKILQSQAYSAVVLDRRLPDSSADRFLTELRETAPQMDVIIVTGYTDLDSAIHALRLGAADYIIKPVNPDALRASLSRIAERKRIERELFQEQEFARKVLATADAIVLVLDTEGTIQRINPYLASVCGWSTKDVVGSDWFDNFIPEYDRERVRQIFLETAAGIETRGVVNAIMTRDGMERQVRWSNTTLKDEKGITTSVLAVGLDVTDMIEAQERLLQSERLATIGQTMTALAHESRNSLQRIQASVDILGLELEQYPHARADLDSIARATRDLHTLLEEVRSFAAPIQLSREPTRVSSLWENAWQRLQSSLRERTADLQTPVQFDDVMCNVDVLRMEQVFRNLFENSLEACRDPVEIRITCRRSADGSQLVISISDNGPGMDAGQAKRVFDAFFTTKSTGTGLGMAIVRRIIEAHGGTIQVAKRDARRNSQGLLPGAAFTIMLPMARG